MDAVIEKSKLTSFYEYFEKEADPTVVGYWAHKQYEGVGGRQVEEVSFHGGFIILQALPKSTEGSPEFMLLVSLSKESRIYKHAAYLMGMFANFHFRDPLAESLKVKTYGNAYQAFLLVNTYRVDGIQLNGTLERVDRFGNQSEKEISKITGVVLTRKEQR